MDKIKVGVIGVGYLGRFHAQKYAAMEDVDLVGVADTDRASAERVAAECQSRPYYEYRQLLPLVDAVSIVVPTVTRTSRASGTSAWPGRATTWRRTSTV